MASSSRKPGRTRRSTSASVASGSHTRNVSAQKTEITIHVYDLLPLGRLSSMLWTIGSSLLHSGVVINGKEYAYGGHNKRGITGVYYTKPRFEPPGGTFRTDILQGFTFSSEAEINQTIKDVSDEFLGPSYNLLTHNCNHFTNALCQALTGKPAPGWLNRAASIGLALPCMVPREWISPPDAETAEGELLEEDEDEYADENAGMLASDRRRRHREEQQRNGSTASRVTRDDNNEEDSKSDEELGASLVGGRRIRDSTESPPPRLVSRTDSAGRPLPAAERAPVPKIMNTTSTK